MSQFSDRFWSSAKVVGECLEWQKSLRPNGYGQVNWDGKITRCHRVAYELANGPIPDGMNVCHRCDNRKCIRPEHLFLGSYKDNNRDMFAKLRGHIFDGTQATGTLNVNAKLDPSSVVEIRRLRDSGMKLQSIADRYKVTKQAIWHCVHGKTWQNVRAQIAHMPDGLL